MPAMTFRPDDLKRSIDSTTAPAYVTGGDGRIQSWNAAAEALLGHSTDEVRGRRCDQVIDGRDVFGNPVCGPQCPVRRRVRNRQALQRFRLHARAATDYYVEVECTSLYVRNDNGAEAIIHLLQPVPDGRHRFAPPGEDADTRETRRIGALTPRETEVLRLLAAGLGTRALAEELSISTSTVRTHVENILQKLDAHSRLEAVALALRKGLL